MKLAITGHSGGLGLAIATKFENEGHEVVGFSLDNGYDITDRLGREQIMLRSMSSDVFVNCAHSRATNCMSQTHMFNEIYKAWQKEDRHIINIGSIVTDWMVGPYRPGRAMYRSAKAALEATTLEASGLRNPCHVTTLKPDWIESDELTMIEEEAGKKAPYVLKPSDVADLVYYIVTMRPIMTITSVTLRGPRVA